MSYSALMRNRFVITKSPISIHHGDVIKWKHFPRYWPFVRGIHRSTANSPHKVQWRGALMFSLICALINGYDVTVMIIYDYRNYYAELNQPVHGCRLFINWRCGQWLNGIWNVIECVVLLHGDFVSGWYCRATTLLISIVKYMVAPMRGNDFCITGLFERSPYVLNHSSHRFITQ